VRARSRLPSTDETRRHQGLYNSRFRQLARFCGGEKGSREESCGEEGSCEESRREEDFGEEGSCEESRREEDFGEESSREESCGEEGFGEESSREEDFGEEGSCEESRREKDFGEEGSRGQGRAKKKTKAPFKVRDKVVYPHHGAATIVKREKIEFAGEKQEYYVLQVATDQLTLRVPVENAIERGVRPVISKNKARQVFATFKDEPQEAGANWSRWYKLLTEKINSGDIFQVAEVVRDLTYAQQVKGISPALKRMLAKARLIIVSELQFSLGLSEEKTIEKLDRALPSIDLPDDA